MTLVGNFFGNLGNVFSDWKSFLEFLQETAMLLPLLLEFIIPITVLLATITTFSSFNKNSELLAMRSSGIGGFRLALPVLLVSIGISIFAYFCQNYIYTWMHQTWVKQENTNRLLPIWKVGEDQSIYYFGNRQDGGQLRDITSFRLEKKPYHLVGRTSIERGEKQKNSWIFHNVIKHFFQNGILKMEFLEQWRVETKELPTVSFENPIAPHHQPLFDLYADTVKLQGEGLDVTRHWIEFFQKTAYPFQIVIMILIGLGLSVSYDRRGMVAESVAISCLLGILYWMFNQITMAIGSAGILLPFLAAWSGNFVFLFLALFILYYNRI
tara:strand:- start:827 stop:1801 length:975 start_codon:yes stop_codon:yes gene_type:complete